MRAGARFTVSPFKWSGRIGPVLWCWGGVLFCLFCWFLSTTGPVSRHSWIYLDLKHRVAKTATIVMMRAAIDPKKNAGDLIEGLPTVCCPSFQPGFDVFILRLSLRHPLLSSSLPNYCPCWSHLRRNVLFSLSFLETLFSSA